MKVFNTFSTLFLHFKLFPFFPIQGSVGCHSTTTNQIHYVSRVCKNACTFWENTVSQMLGRKGASPFSNID